MDKNENGYPGGSVGGVTDNNGGLGGAGNGCGNGCGGCGNGCGNNGNRPGNGNTGNIHLKNDNKELSVAYGADVNKQYEIVKQIYELLEDGMGGSVSLYYLDTERGHTFGYGQDKQYPSACTVAVPFALSLLEAA